MVSNDSEVVLSPCHCALLRKASRHVSHAYDTAIASTGLKTTQLSRLATIDRAADSPPTQKRLAEMMVMDRSTLGQNLRPLEKQGFIILKTDKDDARSKRVRLTSKGRLKLREALVLWGEMQSRFEQSFGAESTATLRRVLHALATTDFSAATVSTR